MSLSHFLFKTLSLKLLIAFIFINISCQNKEIEEPLYFPVKQEYNVTKKEYHKVISYEEYQKILKEQYLRRNENFPQIKGY